MKKQQQHASPEGLLVTVPRTIYRRPLALGIMVLLIVGTLALMAMFTLNQRMVALFKTGIFDSHPGYVNQRATSHNKLSSVVEQTLQDATRLNVEHVIQVKPAVLVNYSSNSDIADFSPRCLHSGIW